MGKIAKQTKPYSNIRNGWCNGTDIRWKVNILTRGGLTDMQNFLQNVWSNACRDKPAEVIVMG